MKFYLLVLISIISITSFSQTAPPFINYQGVARNASGVPVTNSTNPNISIKFEIYPSLIGGSFSFSEVQQNIPLSSLGLFSTKIGAINNLNSVNWTTGSWYLEVFIDLNNGSNPSQSLGRQQLVSVPYAFYADKAGSAPAPTVTFSNNVLSVGGNSATISSGTTYSAGNGIAISGGVITNTLPQMSTTITGSGLATVSPSVSNIFNVNVPLQTLSLTSGSVLTSNLGGNVNLPLTTITQSTNIGVTGNPINGYTITNTAPGSSSTALVAGNTNVQLIPGLNSYTINSHSYNLSNNSNTLTLQNAPGSVSNTVVMPLTTVTPSNGIGISGNPLSGYIITNTATPVITFTSATVGTLNSGSGTSSTFTIPSPVLNGGTGIAVSGIWPNQTISALSSGSNAAWSTLGNTGTNPPSNFLGTTDNKEIVFKTNNNQHAVITTSGNVGIGIPSPLAKLDVSGSTPTALNVLNTSTGNAITANNNSGTPGIIVTNSGGGYALEAQNSSAGGSIHGFKGAGTAGGSAGVFNNSSNINSSPVLNVTNSGTSAGNVINANTSGAGIGLNVVTTSGNAISANNSSSVAPTIVATNSGGNNAINATASGAGNGVNINAANGFGLIVTNTGANPAINANNTGGGTSINALSSGSSDGVFINNTGSGNALNVTGNSAVQTLLVNNSGNGGAIYAGKVGATQGYAGYFENLNQNNSIETLRAANASTVNGAIALNVTSAPTGTGQVGLQINNGHLKSTLSGTLIMPTPTTATATLGFILGGNSFTLTNNTDTKGTLVIDNTATGISPGGYMDINVPFKKHYNIGATVLITPVVATTNSDKYTYYLVGQTNSFFTIRIKNNTAGSITNLSSDRFIINYFVIE